MSEELLKVKLAELRRKDVTELKKFLDDLNAVIFKTKMSAKNGRSVQTRIIRNQIARVKLLISQALIKKERLKYKGSKYVPKDLRPKKTHALRLKLSEKQRTKKTLRQQKKRIHCPRRVYAVKA